MLKRLHILVLQLRDSHWKTAGGKLFGILNTHRNVGTKLVLLLVERCLQTPKMLLASNTKKQEIEWQHSYVVSLHMNVGTWQRSHWTLLRIVNSNAPQQNEILWRWWTSSTAYHSFSEVKYECKKTRQSFEPLTMKSCLLNTRMSCIAPLETLPSFNKLWWTLWLRAVSWQCDKHIDFSVSKDGTQSGRACNNLQKNTKNEKVQGSNHQPNGAHRIASNTYFSLVFKWVGRKITPTCRETLTTDSKRSAWMNAANFEHKPDIPVDTLCLIVSLSFPHTRQTSQNHKFGLQSVQSTKWQKCLSPGLKGVPHIILADPEAEMVVREGHCERAPPQFLKQTTPVQGMSGMRKLWGYNWEFMHDVSPSIRRLIFADACPNFTSNFSHQKVPPKHPFFSCLPLC